MKYDHKVKFGGVLYLAEEQIMPFDDTDIAFEGSDEKYTYEDLSAMTVKDIRKLAEDNGIMITKVIKDEVIGEFLSQQI